MREGPDGPGLISWTGGSAVGRSETPRSGILSALGPVGGATARPAGTLAFGAVGAVCAVELDGVVDAAGVVVVGGGPEEGGGAV
jgi:hypothetical protein